MAKQHYLPIEVELLQDLIYVATDHCPNSSIAKECQAKLDAFMATPEPEPMSDEFLKEVIMGEHRRAVGIVAQYVKELEDKKNGALS